MNQMKISTLKTEEALIDYLLSAKDMLRNDDWSGWCKSFAPAEAKELSPSQPPPAKRRRESPFLGRVSGNLPPCRNPECGLDMTIEDVAEGSVVCIQCGMIQSTVVLVDDVGTAMSGPVINYACFVAHRYSRIVYWHANMMSIQGDTNPMLREGELQSLQLFFQNDGKLLKPGVAAIQEAVRKKIVPYRLRRHAPNLAWRLWPKECPVLPVLSDEEVRSILQQLRRYESVWDKKISGKNTGSVKYFPFRFLWGVVCTQLGYPHLVRLFLPPKQRRPRRRVRGLCRRAYELLSNEDK